MAFVGKQVTFEFKQVNTASPDKVFPLLCPVREKDWLDGWDYEMIHSVTGLAEKDCVFSTFGQGQEKTIWHITQHNQVNHSIEFVRFTPNLNVVKININLEGRQDGNTETLIKYQYTGLNEDQNNFIEDELEESFTVSMQWWEKAINYYLETGEMLKLESS